MYVYYKIYIVPIDHILPLYPVDIAYGINFSDTTAMTSQWIIKQYCWNDARNFCIKDAT